MSTVPADKRQTRMVSVSLNAECEELLDAVAETIGEGSRSAAVRHLIYTHAGRVVNGYKEEHPEWEIPKWTRRRLSFGLAVEICRWRRAGNTRADSFTLAGVSANQARRWLAQGRSDVNAGKSSVHADFAMGLELAEAELKREELEKARKAGDYKFVLSRQFPDDYAERKRTDQNVRHTFTPVVDWEKGTLEEARMLVALLRKFSPDADDPAISRFNRPAEELIPPDMAASILDLEATELEDESPSARSPAASTHESPTTSTKAPSLEEEQRNPIDRSPVIPEPGRRAAEPDLNSDRLMLDPGPPSSAD